MISMIEQGHYRETKNVKQNDFKSVNHCVSATAVPKNDKHYRNNNM
jgi:hypothetical protein